MPITMICPHLSCGRTITAPDTARGKVLRCSHCKRTFLVPDPAPAEAEDTEAAKQNPKAKR